MKTFTEIRTKKRRFQAIAITSADDGVVSVRTSIGEFEGTPTGLGTLTRMVPEIKKERAFWYRDLTVNEANAKLQEWRQAAMKDGYNQIVE